MQPPSAVSEEIIEIVVSDTSSEEEADTLAPAGRTNAPSDEADTLAIELGRLSVASPADRTLYTVARGAGTTAYWCVSGCRPYLPHARAFSHTKPRSTAAASRISDEAAGRSLVKRKKPHMKSAAYVVFRGRTPGVYRHWYGFHTVLYFALIQVHCRNEAQTAFRNQGGAVYSGYTSYDAATKAYEYAVKKGFTQVTRAKGAVQKAVTVSRRQIVTDTAVACERTPLSNGAAAPRWHVIYCGLQPGIFDSMCVARGFSHFVYLPVIIRAEAGCYVLSIPNAVYDSYVEYASAVNHYKHAVLKGEVYRVTIEST